MLEGEVLYGAHHTGKSISYGKLGVGYGKVHGYTGSKLWAFGIQWPLNPVAQGHRSYTSGKYNGNPISGPSLPSIPGLHDGIEYLHGYLRRSFRELRRK